jgi:hypothetical protein
LMFIHLPLPSAGARGSTGPCGEGYGGKTGADRSPSGRGRRPGLVRDVEPLPHLVTQERPPATARGTRRPSRPGRGCSRGCGRRGESPTPSAGPRVGLSGRPVDLLALARDGSEGPSTISRRAPGGTTCDLPRTDTETRSSGKSVGFVTATLQPDRPKVLVRALGAEGVEPRHLPCRWHARSLTRAHAPQPVPRDTH